MTVHPCADGARMLTERAGKEQPGERKEGPEGARWQVGPVGRGQAQGTGFLVNSAACSKNTSALDRAH